MTRIWEPPITGLSLDAFLWLILLLFVLPLATWRISNLFANEAGPFHIFKRIRIFLRAWCIFGPEHGIKFFCRLHAYELMECEYCNSVWIGTGIVLAYLLIGNYLVIGLSPLALSTCVIFLKKTHEKLGA